MIPPYFLSLLMLVNVSADVLNYDLKAIENWAFQWKMNFNPAKQAEQVNVFLQVYQTGTS